MAQEEQEPKGLYPDADPKKYETKLSPADEIKFQSWLVQNAKEGKISAGDYNHYKEKGYGYDYDMRAAFQKGIKPEINPDDKKWHWDDYGKKPNEPTFSDQSKYNGVDNMKGGTWNKDTFIPPKMGMLNTPNYLYDNKPTLDEISKIAEQKYEPSQSVKNTKSLLAAASMLPIAGIPAGLAKSVYDLGTGVKYAADNQLGNATEDIGQGLLGLLPTGVLMGMGLKAKQIKSLKDIAQTAIQDKKSSQQFRDISTGKETFIDKMGTESTFTPRRSVPNPDYTDTGNEFLKKYDPYAPYQGGGLKDIKASGGSTTKIPKRGL